MDTRTYVPPALDDPPIPPDDPGEDDPTVAHEPPTEED